MLGESGHAGVGVGRERRIVLVEVLQAERVFLAGVVVEIGHGQVSRESARAGDEGVVEVGACRRRAIARASLGISHLPGSPGSAGELKRTSAVRSIWRGDDGRAAEVAFVRCKMSC